MPEDEWIQIDSLADQLLETKLYREHEVRRPFQKALQMAEQKATRLHVRQAVKEAVVVDSLDESSAVVSFAEYYKQYYHLIQSPTGASLPVHTPDIVKVWMTVEQSPTREDIMIQAHSLVRKLLEDARTFILQRNNDIEYTELFFLSPHVQHLFTPLSRLYSTRSETSFLSGYKGLHSNCIVIRTAVENIQTNQHTILYESIVGSLLNSLRSITPCFMYSYGGTLNKSKKKGIVRFTACNEYIKGDDFMSAICDLSVEQSLQMLLLLSYALFAAHKRCEFRHNHLTSKCVRIRPIKPKKYAIKDYTFTVSYIPVIVDYASASIRSFVSTGEYLSSPQRPLIAVNPSIAKSQASLPIWDLFTFVHSVVTAVRSHKLHDMTREWTSVLEWLQSSTKLSSSDIRTVILTDYIESSLRSVSIEDFIGFLINDRLKKPFEEKMSE